MITFLHHFHVHYLKDIPSDRSSNDWKEYYYNFEITLPAVKLQNLDSSIILPKFTYLIKQIKNIRSTSEEMIKLRKYYIDYYNYYLAE